MQQNEKGATLVEYVLLAALIVIVCIAGMTALGGSADARLTGVSGSIDATS